MRSSRLFHVLWVSPAACAAAALAALAEKPNVRVLETGKLRAALRARARIEADEIASGDLPSIDAYRRAI